MVTRWLDDLVSVVGLLVGWMTTVTRWLDDLLV